MDNFRKNSGPKNSQMHFGLLSILAFICLLVFLGSPNFSLFQNTEDLAKESSDLEEFTLPSKEIASALNISVCSNELMEEASEKSGESKKLFGGLSNFQTRLLKSFNKDSFEKLVGDIKNFQSQITTKNCLPPLVVGGTPVPLEVGVKLLLDEQIITCGFTPQLNPGHGNTGYLISDSINNYISFLASNKVVKKSEKKLRNLEAKRDKLRSSNNKVNLKEINNEILKTQLAKSYADFYNKYGQLLATVYESVCVDVQDLTSPSIPTGLSFAASTKELSWGGSADSYIVYLSSDQGVSYQKLVRTNNKKVVLSNLSKNYDYLIKVVAIQALQKISLVSDYSQVLKVRIKPLPEVGTKPTPNVSPSPKMTPSPTPLASSSPRPTATASPNPTVMPSPSIILAPKILSPTSNYVDAVNGEVTLSWSVVDDAIGYLVRVDEISNDTRTRVFNSDNYLETSYNLDVDYNKTYEFWVHSKASNFDINNEDTYSEKAVRVFTVNKQVATPKPSPTATPSPTPKVTPSPTSTPRPTATPSSTPKVTPSPTTTPRPTATPSPTPKVTPSPTSTPRPTATPARFTDPIISPPISRNVVAINNQVEVRWNPVTDSDGYLLRVDKIVNNTRTRIFTSENYAFTSYPVSVQNNTTYDLWVHSKTANFDYNNLASYSEAVHVIFTVTGSTSTPSPSPTSTLAPPATPVNNCIGESTQSCTITNGTGLKTRSCAANNNWSDWSTCSVVSCNSGYASNGTACNATGSVTMNVGAPQLLLSNFNTSHFSDMSSPTLRKSATEFYTWTGNGDYSFKKFSGTLANPFQTQIWSDTNKRWDYTGIKFDLGGVTPTGQTYYRPWMANVYKHPDGTLIGFVHIETAVYDDKARCRYRQGIAISTNGGDNWKYVGDVLKPQFDGFSNLGGTPLLIVGDYFYQYFNEVPNGSPRIPAVARAKITEVVNAAKLGTVSPWKKYNNGNWNQDGLTGVASNITPYPDRYDMHTDAVYSAALGKYLLVAWEQVGYEYADNPAKGRKFGEIYPDNRGLYIYTSTDGVNWGNRVKAYTPVNAKEENPYPFFGGLEAGSSDDFNVLGGNFFLYFPDRINHKFFRIPITFSGVSSSKAPSTVKKIMPLGDSITYGTFPGGYRKDLANYLSTNGINFDYVGASQLNPANGVDPDHNGYPGYRTDQILSKLPSWLALNPEMVLLHLGTNDLMQGKTTSFAINNLKSIINLITTNAPHRRVYVATIVPIINAGDRTPAPGVVESYNAQIRNLVQTSVNEGRKVTLVDMNNSAIFPVNPIMNAAQPGDGIHPGQQGYTEMAKLWMAAIRSYL